MTPTTTTSPNHHTHSDPIHHKNTKQLTSVLSSDFLNNKNGLNSRYEPLPTHSILPKDPKLSRHHQFSQSLKNPPSVSKSNQHPFKSKLEEHVEIDQNNNNSSTDSSDSNNLNNTNTSDHSNDGPVTLTQTNTPNTHMDSCTSTNINSSTLHETNSPIKKKQHPSEVTVAGIYKQISGQNIFIQLWDTHSSPRYMSLNKSYFRSALGAIIMYDITEPEGLDQVQKWLLNLRNTAKSKLSILLIGNKYDLKDKRMVPVEMALEFSKVHGLLFCECSHHNFISYVEDAKTGKYTPMIDKNILNEFYTRMYLRSVT